MGLRSLARQNQIRDRHKDREAQRGLTNEIGSLEDVFDLVGFIEAVDCWTGDTASHVADTTLDGDIGVWVVVADHDRGACELLRWVG